MNELSLDTVLRRSEVVVATERDGRTSLMDIVSGRHYNLEGPGARIFALFDSPRTLGDVRAQLLREFDVPPHVCDSELRTFVTTLMANGLLETAHL